MFKIFKLRCIFFPLCRRLKRITAARLLLAQSEGGALGAGGERAEQVDRVREAIDGMGPTDREVLAMRHFERFDSLSVTHKGRQDVASAVIATTLVLVAVFIPVSLMPGGVRTLHFFPSYTGGFSTL